MALAASGCWEDSPPPPPPPRPAPAAAAPTPPPSRLLPEADRFVRTQTARGILRLATAGRRLQKGFANFQAELRNAQDRLNDLQTYIRAGRQALADENFRAALPFFRRAVELDALSLPALRGLAASLVGTERFAEAVDVYGTIAGLSPTDRTPLFDLAVVQSRLGRLTDAEATYRKLLVGEEIDDATLLKAAYNLATVYQAQGKLAAAMEMWRVVTARAPHLAGAHSQFGEVLLLLGRPEEAMAAYAEAAKLQPMNVSEWLNLATAAHAAGSYGRAVVATRRATELAPRDAFIWRRLGDLLLDLHRATGQEESLAEAVDAWRKSLQCDPAQQDLRDLVATYESAVAKPPSKSGGNGP